MNFVIFVLGILMGIAFCFLYSALRNYFPKKKTASVLAESEDGYQSYGLSIKPVPTLLKLLPEPPDSHVWEVRTRDAKVGENGNDDAVFLSCELINLLAPQDRRVVTSAPEVDLVWETYHPQSHLAEFNHTWIGEMRKYPGIYTSDEMRIKVLGPVLDWAVLVTDRFNREKFSGGEYAMKG